MFYEQSLRQWSHYNDTSSKGFFAHSFKGADTLANDVEIKESR